MKKIKFNEDLISLILNGEKTTTWRLFDDKNLSRGDELILLVSQTHEEFAKARILFVKKTTFNQLDENDWEGHETFSSKEEMFKTYSKYYNREVDEYSPLKIIKFELIEKYSN